MRLTPFLTGIAAAAAATQVKTYAEGVLQPLGERIFPPDPVAKRELGADPQGHPENMPPAELAGRAAEAVGGKALSDEQRQQTSQALHWGMGLGAGVTYALLAQRFPQVRAGRGLGFGAVLFAATHGSLLPALGVQHPVGELPRAWWIWEAGSHLVYGATVDAGLTLADRLRR